MTMDPDVFNRDHIVQGDPNSGAYKIVKSQERQWKKTISRLAAGNTVNVATLAELNAITGSANQGGMVWGDSTGANNGVYSWDATSSPAAWVRIAALPHTAAVLTNIAGTANAITADTETGVDPAEVKLFFLPDPPGTNTSTSMTLIVNGGEATFAIKAASGSNVAIGDVIDGVGTLFFRVTDTEIRQLVSSQTGAAFDHQGDYNALTTYTEGQIVTGSDNAWYQLKTASATGDDPVSGGSGDWLKIFTDAGDFAGLSGVSLINASPYNAACDFTSVAGTVSITSGAAALEVVGASFTASDVGKLICVPGAGAAGAELSTTISAVGDSENITLSDNAGTTLSAVSTDVYYATDDKASIQAAIDAAEAAGGGVVVVPTSYCGVSGTIVCDANNVTLMGFGKFQSGIIGFHAAGHVVHFDGSSTPIIGNAFEGLYVDSVVAKTSGAGLCFEAAARGRIENFRLSGQDGFGGQSTPKLYDGLDLNAVDRFDVDGFQINCQNDSIIVNGSTPGGSLPRGSDVYLDQGKILGEGVGIHCAGDVGGLKLGAVSINNTDDICILFDQSRVASGNRQTFISSLCDIDGESVGGVRQQHGIKIDDAEMEDLIIDGVWFSVLKHAIWIDNCSPTKTKIKITGGRIAQCDQDGIRIDSVPALLTVNGTEFSDIVGWAVNATVDCTNLGNGRGVFIFPGCTFYNCVAGDVVWNNVGMLPGTSISRAIADDGVFVFKPRDLTTLGSSGLLLVDRANSANKAFIYYRAESGGSGVANISVTGVTTTTGALTGTTGADGALTVSAHTDEKIYIENRLGSQVTVYISLLAAHPGANLQTGP